SRDDALSAARRVLSAINQPVIVSGLEIPVSASLGIVFASDCVDADPSVLLRNGELAMYVAKSRRADDAVVFEQGMHQEAFERLKLKTDLGRAVANRELEIHYQPIVELNQRRVIGFEALVRWRHPTRGMVSPATFIP